MVLPLPLDVGVEVLAHLGLLLDVPLMGLLDEATHMELGGVFHLLGHQLLLGIDLLLLLACKMAVIPFQSLEVTHLQHPSALRRWLAAVRIC